MATNTFPGCTRRESYSTPVTCGFPLWARISTPSSRARKVIAVIVLQVGKQQALSASSTELHRDGRAAGNMRARRGRLLPGQAAAYDFEVNPARLGKFDRRPHGLANKGRHHNPALLHIQNHGS